MSILKELTSKALLEARLNAPVEGTQMDAPNQKGIAKQMGMDAKGLFKANTRHADTLEELGAELQSRLDHVTRRGMPTFDTVAVTKEFPNPDPKTAAAQPTVALPTHDPEQGIWEGKAVLPRDIPDSASVYDVDLPRYSGKVPNSPYKKALKNDAPGKNERLAYAQGHLDKFRAALEAHRDAQQRVDPEAAMTHMLAATDHLINAANAAVGSRPGDDKKAIGIAAGGKTFKRWNQGGSLLSDNWRPEGLPWKPNKTGDNSFSPALSDWTSLEHIHPQVQTILGAYRKHVANTVGLPDSAYHDPKVAGGRTYNRYSVSPTAFADERLTNEQVVKARGGRAAGGSNRSGTGDDAMTSLAEGTTLSTSGAPLTLPTRPEAASKPSWYETRQSIVNHGAPWSNPNMSGEEKFSISQQAHDHWRKNGPLGSDYFKSPAYKDPESYLGLDTSTSVAHAAPEVASVLAETGQHDDNMSEALKAAQADFEKESRNGAFGAGRGL